MSQRGNRPVNARRMPRPRAARGHCSRSQWAGTGDVGSQFQQGRHLKAGATPISGAGPMSALSRVRLDEFTTAMLATVMLAFLLPGRGASAGIFDDLAAAAIGLLFFLQGARLSRAAIIAGALHWRLHLVILLTPLCCFRSSDWLCGRYLG